MRAKRQRGLGVAAGLGAVAAVAMGGLIGCGDDFSGEDCKVRHTCAANGGEAGAEPAEGGEGGSTTAGKAGAGGSNQGGTQPTAGELNGGIGGIGGIGDIDAPMCVPADCDNGNPSDGVETCGDDGECVAGNPPPVVFMVSPSTGAGVVEPGATIELTFSEPLDEATLAEGVQVFDGDAVVEGEVSHADGKVTFKPKAPLALLAEYTINVTTAVTDAAGAALLEPYTSTFVTRDGAWHVEGDAVTGDLYRVPATLPVTAKGDVLLAWIASTTSPCPTSARWFNSGEPIAATKVWAVEEGVFSCNFLGVGANADGVAAVTWQEQLGEGNVEQFRAGKWAANPSPPVLQYVYAGFNAVGVAPNGAVSFLQHASGNGTYARSTNVNGAWSGAGTNIAAGHRGLAAPSFAFDSKNNGFAAWRAENASGNDEIMVARYTQAGGWEQAAALPGSLAASNAETNRRGAPAVAVDEDGGALVLWLRETDASLGSLVSSRYSEGGWGNPTSVSGALVAVNMLEQPGLVFDGARYVAAWTAKDGANHNIYSSVFGLQFEQWESYEKRSSGAVPARMPAIGVDGHRNLIITWLQTQAASSGTLGVARFDARSALWTSPTVIAGATVKDNLLTDDRRPTPLGVGSNGYAAVAWGDENAQGDLEKIRLASFY